MVRRSICIGGIVVLMVGVCLSPAIAQTVVPPGPAGPKPQVAPAPPAPVAAPAVVPAPLQHAMDAKKYLFIFFHQAEDQETAALKTIFEATMAKVTDRAESLIVNVKDASQRPLVSKFQADRAPMPMVLALAPNGAVTGGYPLKFDEQLLMGAFCSRSTWESLKALQDGKLVFLCVQNASTRFGAEALKAVRDAKADEKYDKLTEVVTIDPGDATEADSLKRLKVDPKTNEAVTILFAPPATVINRFTGAVTKEAILAELQKAAAGKGACCPGGACGPKPGATPSAGPNAGAPQPPGPPAPKPTNVPPPPKAGGNTPQPGGPAPKP
jgi:hypothetical protein